MRLALLGLWLLTTPTAPGTDLKAIGELVERGDLKTAELQLRRVVAEDGQPAAHDLLGVVLQRQGRLEEAAGEFRAALAKNPLLLEARQHLARLEFARHHDTEALSELRLAARQGPLERDLALRLATAELSQGHTDEATRQLRSVAERFQSVRALISLARLQSEQHDLRGARESLRQAQMIAPNSEDVLASLGEASLGARDPVAAILALEPLTRICPTVARYPYLLGVSLLEAGDVSAAVESLKNAERLDPNGVLTLTALGLALNGEKAYGDAKKYLTRSLDFEPENVESLAALAESEEGLGDLARAEAFARRALAKVETHVTANVVLGMVLMKQERYAEARDALERAVAASPMSSKAHYQLSLAYARLDDPQSSERHLELYRMALKENEERLRELRATPAPR